MPKNTILYRCSDCLNLRATQKLEKAHTCPTPMLSLTVSNHKNLSFLLRSITKSYYRNSVGALLVYDICNRDSYKHIPVWMMEAKRHIEPHKAVFILVGCKLDIAADEDQVS